MLWENVPKWLLNKESGLYLGLWRYHISIRKSMHGDGNKNIYTEYVNSGFHQALDYEWFLLFLFTFLYCLNISHWAYNQMEKQQSNFHSEKGKRMSNDLFLCCLKIIPWNIPHVKRCLHQNVLDGKTVTAIESAQPSPPCPPSWFPTRQAVCVVFQKYSSDAVTPVLQFFQWIPIRGPNCCPHGTQHLGPVLAALALPTLFQSQWCMCNFQKHPGFSSWSDGSSFRYCHWEQWSDLISVLSLPRIVPATGRHDKCGIKDDWKHRMQNLYYVNELSPLVPVDRMAREVIFMSLRCYSISTGFQLHFGWVNLET